MLRPKQSRFKKFDPVFHVQGKDADSKELSDKVIKEAREKGELNLSRKGLSHVPVKVWRINDFDDEEIKQLDVRFDGDGEKWWEPEPLRLLDLSSNSIKHIPPDIRNLESLNTLILDNNSLDSLPQEIGRLNQLTHLSLKSNRLKTLPGGFFHLTELTQLSLADNLLESLHDDVANLIMLQKLDLSNNSLVELPPSIGFLTRLTELKVSHNQLTEIPPDLGNLRVLTVLMANHNEVSTLPPLGELTKMEVLSLAHNKLTALPQVLGCIALKEIYLQNNHIQELDEDTFEAMMHLKVLDLQHNKIEAIPEQIGQLRHVVQLNLSNNAITTLPAVLCSLPHLRSLQVADNPIQNVRRDIVHCGTQRTLQFLRNSMDRSSCELPVATNELSNPDQTFPDRFTMRGSRSLSLASRALVSVPDSVFEEAEKAEVVYVDVSNNKLSEPPSGLCVLKGLVTELNLSCNLIGSVSACIADLSKLQYLDLQRNCLEDLPAEMGTLLRLRELNVSFNRFSSLPECVYDLVGLEILVAENNKLDSIDVESLQRLVRLATLDLRNNDISFVPPELGNLKLKSLELSGNSFRTPRHAILEKGTESVLAYLRDRIQQ